MSEQADMNLNEAHASLESTTRGDSVTVLDDPKWTSAVCYAADWHGPLEGLWRGWRRNW